MLFNVKKEIKAIKIAYENFEIDLETAYKEVENMAKYENDDVFEAISYFEKIANL